MNEESLQEKSPTKFPYQTFGPFLLADGVNLSSLVDANEFWDEVEEKHPGLQSAIGVYIFALRSNKNSAFIPWYVGKTERAFEKRFHSHRDLFGKLLGKNRSIAIFLLARLHRETNDFMGSRKTLDSNDVLETMLIDKCLSLNPKLLNASKTKYVKGLVVPGFRGKSKGKLKSSARQLECMLSGSAPKEF